MYKCSQSFQCFRIDFREYSVSQVEEVAMVAALVKDFFRPLFNDFPVGEKQCRIQEALEGVFYTQLTCFTDGGSPVDAHYIHTQFEPFRNKEICIATVAHYR